MVAAAVPRIPGFTEITVADAHSDSHDQDEIALSDWTERLQLGDPDVTHHLWNTYFQRMVRVAKQRMGGVQTAARDEEDVALSAFKSFCLGVQSGRIPLDPDDENLWPLLVTMTLNKSLDQVRYENRLKRTPHGTSETRGTKLKLEELISQEPSPIIAAAASETLQMLLDSLQLTQDTTLQRIAVESIQGSSAAEIARMLKCSQRTVQRKLKTIKTLWETKFDHD